MRALCVLPESKRVQSYEWGIANKSARREKQAGMREAGGKGGGGTPEKASGPARAAAQKAGYVDFRGNYWGPEATRQMRSSSAFADVGVIYDYFDRHAETVKGKRYKRDMVDYSGYLAKSPLER